MLSGQTRMVGFKLFLTCLILWLGLRALNHRYEIMLKTQGNRQTNKYYYNPLAQKNIYYYKNSTSPQPHLDI